MAQIDIPNGTLERLRDMEQDKQRIQQRQSLIVQTLLDAEGVGGEGGVQYDLQAGVIRLQEEQ